MGRVRVRFRVRVRAGVRIQVRVRDIVSVRIRLSKYTRIPLSKDKPGLGSGVASRTAFSPRRDLAMPSSKSIIKGTSPANIAA